MTLEMYDTWDDVPDNLKTKTALGEMGLKLAKGQIPAARKRKWIKHGRHWDEDGFYDLYAVEDAVAKKQPTPAQLAALEKAQEAARASWHCSSCGRRLPQRRRGKRCQICRDKAEAEQWARDMLEKGDFIILDTETTGLEGEILEIGIIDSNGRILMHQRLNPVSEIEPEATAVHGLTADMLAGEPAFGEIFDELKRLLIGRLVVIWNAAFDDGRLRDTCALHNLPRIEMNSTCAMEWYAQHYGEWSDYYGGYRWQPLPGGDHTAVGDARATLDVVRRMAGKDS